ncbi:protein of unknown function [Taphrina deformans PYCC 5710]|uniref:Zn(2)-C6 fungal-type domain-containing protein n=1 Tax=Taphrina deformans (strain PYCC 5710 / ATCC 11124 / CBS 356.35 / IMI 108563 / JCM 9778 / NBRC 8474) TaxID=1097556 RepID=R4XFI8_TAPDE|nr:protein of unknown function [Taphrina deformans PYCC 5710]|eukprot:CCG84531.1 protein of unknown function [Taphrina deformans PYCC 5710]
MQQPRACARCHRLKVRCEQADNNKECNRCSTAGVACEGRPKAPHHKESYRKTKSARSVDELAKIVRNLSESVASLREQQESRHCAIWKTLGDSTRTELFCFYATNIAPGWPVIRLAEGLESRDMQQCRPLLYRSGCVAAMTRLGLDNSPELARETYRYLCDVKLADTSPTIDLIEAFLIVVLYIPYPLEDVFKIISMTTNLVHQALLELEDLDDPDSQCLDPLELVRCRMSVYLLCNSSRIWMKNNHRVIAWGPAYDEAVRRLQAGDSVDQAQADCVLGMRIAEGISFLGVADDSTEEVFRQYLSVYAAKLARPTTLTAAGYAHITPAIFRILHVMSLLEAYLDLFEAGDDRVNVPLAFQALVHEGQGLLDYFTAVRDSKILLPTFYYLRPIRAALTIAYYCKSWAMPYFADLIVRLSTIFDAMVASSPALLQFRQGLARIEAWYYTTTTEAVVTNIVPPATLDALGDALLSSTMPLLDTP